MLPDSENSPLLSGAEEDVDTTFMNTLDHELEKICSFYQLKELEIYGELDSLLRDEASFEAEAEELEDLQDDHVEATQERRRSVPTERPRPRSGSLLKSFTFGKKKLSSTIESGRSNRNDEDSDEDDERTGLTKTKSTDARMLESRDDLRSEFRSSKRRTSTAAFDDYNDMSFSVLYDSSISLKKRIISLYVSLCELRSFIQLNKTGFTKVLKKFDKILDRGIKAQYLEQTVNPSYPFKKDTMDRLGINISQLEQVYATIVTQGKVDEAKRELRLHLREHVVWERNTVWREMIGIERKTQAANMGLRQTMLGQDTDPNARLVGDEAVVEMKKIRTRFGNYTCPKWLFSPTLYTLVVILTVFFVLLLIPFMKHPEQQNCLALVVFVSLLWATEVSLEIVLLSSLISNVGIGYSIVRDVSACAISGYYSTSRPLRPKTIQSVGL